MAAGGKTVAALTYLWVQSALNLLRTRLLRLKQPKYLAGAVLGFAYLYFIFLRPLPAPDEGGAPDVRLGLPDVLVTNVGALALAFVFLLMWLWPRARTALAFSEAEIAFLFPGPLRHRTLVHYTLLRNQAALLLSAFLFALISHRWDVGAGSALSRFIGWWLFMSAYALHHTASGFMLTRLLDRGLNGWQRFLVVLAVVVALFVLLAQVDTHLRLPTPLDSSDAQGMQAYILEMSGSGVTGWLLLPLRLLLAPFVAPDFLALVRALVPALGVWLLFYCWAVLAEVPDADGALAKAQQRANQLTMLRNGNFRLGGAQVKGRTDPFRLSPHGEPATAFLWKGLLATRPYLRLRSALILACLIVALDWWLDRNPALRGFSVLPSAIAFVFLCSTVLIGPQFAQLDLRRDLPNADLLKTWPLAGWQIVMGQLLTPLVILTGILWLCLLQLGVGTPGPREPEALRSTMRFVGSLALGLLLPLFCAIQLVVLNAGALLFPAWAITVNNPSQQGIEVAGQRMLFMIGQWLLLLICLIPAALIGAIAWLLFQFLLGTQGAILPTSLVVALVLLAELAWGINWLGERFEAYDLTE